MMRHLSKKKRMKGVDFVMVTVFVLELELSSSFDFFPPLGYVTLWSIFSLAMVWHYWKSSFRTPATGSKVQRWYGVHCWSDTTVFSQLE